MAVNANSDFEAALTQMNQYRQDSIREKSTNSLSMGGCRDDDASLFLERHGYRRCDIPACNCGSWHGGYANERLAEIRQEFEEDVFTETNGKTLLDIVIEVLHDRSNLKKLARNE